MGAAAEDSDDIIALLLAHPDINVNLQDHVVLLVFQ